MVRRGGTGMRQRRAVGFSISVFVRFAYTLSALDGHYLEMFWEFFGFVRPEQTGYARTAGHLILENPAALLWHIP